MRSAGACALIALCAVIAACARVMAPTPTIVALTPDPYAAVAPQNQTTTVELLYVTDRARQAARGRPVWYGSKRAADMAFGLCTVRLGDDLTWAQLVEETSTSHRRRPVRMRVVGVEELGHLPCPLPPTEGARNARNAPAEVIAAQDQMLGAFYAALSRQLAATSKKDVYVYVHGFRRWFADPMYTMAQMWHYAGREGVPIVYTWPAGAQGILRGYTRDRESGEFTVHHLKSFLVALSRAPGVERVHLIAHSRGADVLITAVRELHIAYESAGLSTQAELKLENLMLAAPDLDADVAAQRIAAESLFGVARRFTIYVSGSDIPLEVADWLFDSDRRLGRARYRDVAPKTNGAPSAVQGACIVDVTAQTPGLGHEYFYDQPQVASDVLLLIGGNRPPGAEYGRPLINKAPGWWELDGSYLLEKAK